MSFPAAICQALTALLAHKGRSALTSLGFVIGIGAVIALVAAGEGARLKLDERLESAGKNLILIRPGTSSVPGVSLDDVPLTSADAEALRKHARSWLVGVAPWQVMDAPVATRTGRWRTVLVGTTADFLRVGEWQVAHGGSFTDEDIKKVAPVCVIGQTVCRKLFPEKPNPVGEWLRLDRVRVRILGVLAEKGFTPLGVDQDDQVFLPLTTLQRHLTGKESLAMILAAPRSAAVADRAKEEIIKVLRRQHRLRPGAANDFDVSTVQELAELAVTITVTLQILVAALAALALVVGGIGLMNIMLVTVTERTREIGIRMAVGATPADVLLQFLLEAVVLALGGGAVGVALGLGAAVALARQAGWPVVLSPAIVCLAFAATATVGVFFGYYPALRASRLDPIEALRHE